jgi:hypothetical protein
LSCREALAAAQNDVGSMRAAQLGDRERLEAALETEAALRREVTQLAATREQLEAALAQGQDIAEVFLSVLSSVSPGSFAMLCAHFWSFLLL